MRFWYSLREKHEKTKVDVSRFLPIRTDENGITKHKKGVHYPSKIMPPLAKRSVIKIRKLIQ